MLVTMLQMLLYLVVVISVEVVSDQSPAVRCFQCSEFPVDNDDQDEPMGPCPGEIYSAC